MDNTPSNLEFHEAANIFPLDEEHLDDLAADIRQNGQQVPIDIVGGKIVDGRRRYLACGRVGVPPRTREIKVADPVTYVLSLNLHRRHLTPSQLAMVGARAREWYDKQGKERQRASGGDRKSGKKSVPVNLPEPIKGDSRDHVGKKVGVSGKTIDYAEKHAANGLKSYQEGLEFADQHKLQVGIAFAMLAGTTSFTNCQSQFIDGTFKIKDRLWADSVAGIYGPMGLMADALKSSRFLEACMAVCRVKDFDAKRLLANAERCREKLVSYSTRDAYLDMLDAVYNYGRKQLVALKHLAVMALRERSVVGKPKKPTAKGDMAA